MIYCKSFAKACTKKHVLDVEPGWYPFVETTTKTTTELIGDRYYSVPKVVSEDIRERDKGVKVSDFYLENLIAVGAGANMTEVRMESGGLNMIDSIESQLSGIEIEEEKNNDEE